MTVFRIVLSFLVHEIWAPQVFIQCNTLYYVLNMQEICVHQYKFCMLKVQIPICLQVTFKIL